ncbi:MAG: CAP domain-containing protein [Burkholderiaceae bacterium]
MNDRPDPAPCLSAPFQTLRCRLAALTAALLLAACGGGGDSGPPPAASTPVTPAQPTPPAEAGAPAATGDMATDGLNWFNFRRRQVGLAALGRNAAIDAAAQGHSNYQKLNETITHVETRGSPGFIGETVPDRLANVGYQFFNNNRLSGEVIAATGNPSGFQAAEELITAIYHRFVVFEPVFREFGGGSAAAPTGYIYFTCDMTADGFAAGVPPGAVAVYPFAGQQGVPTVFYSDTEQPDPVPDRNAVGYPISVHANFGKTLRVDSFTVAPPSGVPLSVRLLTHDADSETPTSAAAIIPVDVLASQTAYAVRFTGAVDGVPVSRAWSFTTR